MFTMCWYVEKIKQGDDRIELGWYYLVGIKVG